MKIKNGPVQFYQQQMLNPGHYTPLNLWNLAHAVISDARYGKLTGRGDATNFRLGGRNLAGGTNSGESKPPTSKF